jgi:uncharacterized protein YcaQ
MIQGTVAAVQRVDFPRLTALTSRKLPQRPDQVLPAVNRIANHNRLLRLARVARQAAADMKARAKVPRKEQPQ